MLYAKNLPSNAGVQILGFSLDFDRLYDSLHEIVGEEGGVSAGAGLSCRLQPDAQPSVLRHVAGETAETTASAGGFFMRCLFWCYNITVDTKMRRVIDSRREGRWRHAGSRQAVETIKAAGDSLYRWNCLSGHLCAVFGPSILKPADRGDGCRLFVGLAAPHIL